MLRRLKENINEFMGSLSSLEEYPEDEELPKNELMKTMEMIGESPEHK